MLERMSGQVGRWLAVLLAGWLAGGATALTSYGQDALEFIPQGLPTKVVRALPKFWIGIMGQPVDDTLKAQLQLAHGLAVTDIVPESPAATAGLRPHDIVLSVNGQPIHGVEDFFQPVERAEGKPLELEIMRAGDRAKIEVRPTERPAEQLARVDFLRLTPPTDGFSFVGPGVVIQADTSSPALPADVSVTISKQGADPAKIVVRRGSDTWETTEDKVETLPEEAQVWARSLLQHASGPGMMPGGPGGIHNPFMWTMHGPQGAARIELRAPAASSESIEQRLDEMAAQIKTLQEALQRQQESPRQ